MVVRARAVPESVQLDWERAERGTYDWERAERGTYDAIGPLPGCGVLKSRQSASQLPPPAYSCECHAIGSGQIALLDASRPTGRTATGDVPRIWTVEQRMKHLLHSGDLNGNRSAAIRRGPLPDQPTSGVSRMEAAS